VAGLGFSICLSDAFPAGILGVCFGVLWLFGCVCWVFFWVDAVLYLALTSGVSPIYGARVVLRVFRPLASLCRLCLNKIFAV